jgi:4-alpha-glucanotransferase
MMFERAADGGFIAPGHYRENALVTFGTHDLATFAGWCSGYDLAVKKSLGLDPGETESERGSTKEALQRTMAWRGLPDIDFLSIMKFLSDTPCRLLMVNLEDALGVKDQVNLPGTTTQHPNWLGRLPVDLENLAHQSSLMGVAEIMCANGRRSPTRAT